MQRSTRAYKASASISNSLRRASYPTSKRTYAIATQSENLSTSRKGVANTILVSVPQETAYIVERFGKYSKTLDAGLAVLTPIIDKIPYVKSLKELALEVPPQSAITSDNITLDIDGVLYIKIVDPYKASYGVEDAEYAVNQLAQTTMRNQVGQMSLDDVLRSRSTLSAKITEAVNEAASAWGVKCLRYEIRDIQPPKSVLLAMHRAAVDRLFG